MAPLRAVLFDLDDTLYDYEVYAESGLRAAADRLEDRVGERFHGELLAMYFDEGITDGTFDSLLARHDLPPDLTGELVEAYHSATDPLLPYEGTVPTLSALSGTVELGLITDGRGGHAKLRRLGIADYFDATLVTPTIEASKRDRAVFETVLAELSVAPESAVYVGDDPRFDTRVPNELGMRTVRLRRGRYVDLEPDCPAAVPDHEIERIGDLSDYLAALAAEQ